MMGVVYFLFNSGKRKDSDSDSYDDDNGLEGSFQIASESDDIVEKGLIAASKLSTQVCRDIFCKRF